MDQMIVDVSSVPDASTGDEVTLLGRDQDEEITVEDWADLLGTIPWEILCLFKSRLPRVEVGVLPDLSASSAHTAASKEGAASSFRLKTPPARAGDMIVKR